jgi:hypothetical protein
MAQQLRASVCSRMFHHDHDAPDAGDDIHGTAHAFHAFARDHPVGEIPVFGDLHGAEDGKV